MTCKCNNRKETRIKEILDAALICFAEKGYYETTIDDIVKKSGLCKGGIYWYFKSKRDIFIGLIDRFLDEDQKLWQNTLENTKLKTGALKNIGLIFIKKFTENKHKAAFFAEVREAAYRDSVIREKIEKSHNDWHSVITKSLDFAIKHKLIRSNIDTKELAIGVASIIKGTMDQYWFCEKKFDYEKHWEFMANMISSYLEKEN
jgi:AcrR family transcriptional regulator